MTKTTFTFAAAMPPRSELLFPSDSWLQAVARAGHTHVCLQNDPFFYPEMDQRHGGDHLCHLLSLYDIAYGPRRRAYQAWLAAVGEHCDRAGLGLAIQLWEPRLPIYARPSVPDDWKGPLTANGVVQALCLRQPAAKEWVLDGFRILVRAVPDLEAITLGVNDNAAAMCPCPSCAQTPDMERLGVLYRDIERACHEVRADCRVIPYDWMWGEKHYEAVFSRMDRPPCVLTRLERNAPHLPDPAHPEWQGKVYDMSLACDETGTDFRQAVTTMARYGGEVLIMPTLSGMFEAFYQPYIPAVGQLLKKFDHMRSAGVSGWVDYDCGGIQLGLIMDLVRIVQHNPGATIEEWHRLLAVDRYGAGAVAPARKIWAAFDEAVKRSPCCLDFDDIRCFSGRFIMGSLPFHPFLPERVGTGARAGQIVIWSDPHLLVSPKAVPAVRHLLGLMRAAIREVPDEFARLAAACDPEKRGHAEVDALVVRLATLAWRSTANFYEWAAVRMGDATVDLRAVLRDEIATTREYSALSRDPRIDHGNMTHSHERLVAMCVPQASADLAHTIDWKGIAQWVDPAPFPELRGDLFAWKIAHLQMQIDELAR